MGAPPRAPRECLGRLGTSSGRFGRFRSAHTFGFAMPCLPTAGVRGMFGRMARKADTRARRLARAATYGRAASQSTCVPKASGNTIGTLRACPVGAHLRGIAMPCLHSGGSRHVRTERRGLTKFAFPECSLEWTEKTLAPLVGRQVGRQRHSRLAWTSASSLPTRPAVR